MNIIKNLLATMVAITAISACNYEPDITMYNPVRGITLEDEAMVIVNDSITLEAVMTPDNVTIPTIIWSVHNASPASCVTVDNYGVVRGHSLGTATIRATPSGQTFYAECAVEVIPVPVIPETITIPSTFEVEETLTATITVDAVLPDTASNKVYWYVVSNDDECITIDRKSGEIAGLKPGTATIHAVSMYDDTIISNECTVTVKSQTFYESITLPATFELSALSSKALEVESYTPNNVTNVGITWEIVSGADVASIDSLSGVVTSWKMGTAKVVAIAADGSNVRSNECTITVTAEVAVNLVKNHSFEDYDNIKIDWVCSASNFVIQGIPTEAYPEMDGDYAIRFSSAGANSYGNVTQDITLPPSGGEAVTYEYGFTAWTAAGDASNGNVYMNILNANGVKIEGTDPTKTAEVAVISTTITIPADYAYETIKVRVEKAGGVHMIDNVYFKKVIK